jgi:ATP synthase protein I
MASPDPTPRKRPNNTMQQVGMVMELPFTLIGFVLVGGGLGYLLDRWLHTSPFLLLLGGLIGFAGGFVDLLRRLKRGERNQGNRNGGS